MEVFAGYFIIITLSLASKRRICSGDLELGGGTVTYQVSHDHPIAMYVVDRTIFLPDLITPISRKVIRRLSFYSRLPFSGLIFLLKCPCGGKVLFLDEKLIDFVGQTSLQV